MPIEEAVTPSQPDALIGTGHTAKITGVTVSGRAMEFVGKIQI